MHTREWKRMGDKTRVLHLAAASGTRQKAKEKGEKRGKVADKEVK